MKKFTFIALLATLLCGCAQFADEEVDTDVQLLGEFRNRTLAIDRHIGNYAALNQQVFVRNALRIVVLLIEEVLQKH